MHLRDTPWCSNSLRSQGLFAPQPRPGFGSREWRRLETEQYTPAPTEKVLEPTGDGSHHRWSDEAASAYRAICGELFEAHSWSDADGLVRAIVGVLSSVPLYASEECDVCDYIAGEVRELRGLDPQLLWDEMSTEIVLQALETAPLSPRAAISECCERSNTLQDFKAEIAAIQWEQIVRGCSFDRETPEATPEILEISWEDGGDFSSGVVDAPTALDDPLYFVPFQLRTVWRRVTQGTVKVITAPPSFGNIPWLHLLQH